MPRFAVEICFTQPETDRFCVAGAVVEGTALPGMRAEVEGHLQRASAPVLAVESLTLKSGRVVDLLVFERATAPWRPFQVDGRVLLLSD